MMETEMMDSMDDAHYHLMNGSHENASAPAESIHQIVVINETVVVPIVCVCGILGIIFTVIVLSRKTMCTSTNCYLIALAIADLLFLLLLATKLLGVKFEHDDLQHMRFQIYGTYAVIFMNVFLFASVWVTVTLAFERYIAICRPFLATYMCTVQRARISIVFIFIFAVLCRLINFWEHKIVTLTDLGTNNTFMYIDDTELYMNEQYRKYYPWVVDVLFVSVIPFLLLLVLNGRLIWEVRKSTRYVQRNTMASNKASPFQREELQITIMLISVVVVFFICQAPYVMYNTIISTRRNSVRGKSFIIFHQVAILLLTLKSAINFLLYCWFSEKFWATFKRTFCFGIGKNKSEAGSSQPAKHNQMVSADDNQAKHSGIQVASYDAEKGLI